MNATSPALNTPLRSEEDAMQDLAHRKHVNSLITLRCWLQEYEARGDWQEAIGYALDELHKNAAARILERNKSDNERICNEMAGRIKGQ